MSPFSPCFLPCHCETRDRRASTLRDARRIGELPRQGPARGSAAGVKPLLTVAHPFGEKLLKIMRYSWAGLVVIAEFEAATRANFVGRHAVRITVWSFAAANDC